MGLPTAHRRLTPPHVLRKSSQLDFGVWSLYRCIPASSAMIACPTGCEAPVTTHTKPYCAVPVSQSGTGHLRAQLSLTSLPSARYGLKSCVVSILSVFMRRLGNTLTTIASQEMAVWTFRKLQTQNCATSISTFGEFHYDLGVCAKDLADMCD